MKLERRQPGDKHHRQSPISKTGVILQEWATALVANHDDLAIRLLLPASMAELPNS